MCGDTKLFSDLGDWPLYRTHMFPPMTLRFLFVLTVYTGL